MQHYHDNEVPGNCLKEQDHQDSFLSPHDTGRYSMIRSILDKTLLHPTNILTIFILYETRQYLHDTEQY